MRATDLFEYFSLDGSSRKTAELADEFPHGPLALEVTIPCHMRAEVTLEPALVVPMWGGWIARAPLVPVRIRCCDIHKLASVPDTPQGQMRIEPSVAPKELFEFAVLRTAATPRSWATGL